MRFGSLFSGIGGLDLGLERAGWECAWQVEIDEWCRAVLARHWPDVPRWDDASTFPPDEGRILAYADERREPAEAALRPGRNAFGTVDLICGGFPCQPVSHAGKRLAQADERWLWPEFARIVRVLRPRYVLIENVPGLLAPVPVRDDAGTIVGWTAPPIEEVFRDLWRCGFDVEWDSIPAAAVGAPHLRYRVLIVAHAKSRGWDERRPPDGGEQARQRTAVQVEAGGSGSDAVENAAGQGRRPTRPIFSGSPGGAGSLGIAARSDWWATEPDVGRVAHGVPSRVDRLRGLGNAVVPQVAEWIGRRLMEIE